MNGLEGKVALVTGGGSGIGRATALLFAAQGAKVVVAHRTQTTGDETVTMIRDAGGDARFVKTDVTVAREVEAMVDATVAAFGRLDCAFNNAGIAGALAETADVTEEDWDVAMNVNLKSVWLCMKHEIRRMLEQGGGSIVNTASAAGLVALPGAAAYAVAKHGVVGLTRTAAIEYVRRGIRINAVCPSFVGTPLTMQVNELYPEFVQKAFALQPIGRVGTPEEIASSVVWLCSDGASFVTGTALSNDGGYAAQ